MSTVSEVYEAISALRPSVEEEVQRERAARLAEVRRIAEDIQERQKLRDEVTELRAILTRDGRLDDTEAIWTLADRRGEQIQDLRRARDGLAKRCAELTTQCAQLRSRLIEAGLTP